MWKEGNPYECLYFILVVGTVWVSHVPFYLYVGLSEMPTLPTKRLGLPASTPYRQVLDVIDPLEVMHIPFIR